MEEAKKLVSLLKSGALPVPLKISEERQISPNLGTHSIKYSKIAFALTFVIIAVIMCLRYGILGLFGIISLIFNILFILACLSLLKTTLTLPGIAGIILTLGMSIDANIVTLERIYEELRKNPLNKLYAISQGFKNSFATIFDSNFTTILAGLSIYYFGFGPIRGFATTLCLGVITSLFTSLVLSKFFTILWVENKTNSQINL
jgi:preprotein translocase subunit SecD